MLLPLHFTILHSPAHTPTMSPEIDCSVQKFLHLVSPSIVQHRNSILQKRNRMSAHSCLTCIFVFFTLTSNLACILVFVFFFFNLTLSLCLLVSWFNVGTIWTRHTVEQPNVLQMLPQRQGKQNCLNHFCKVNAKVTVLTLQSVESKICWGSFLGL